VAASLNPWSHAYKQEKGKVRTNSIMTTLRKHDGSVKSNILDTLNTMLYHLITDDLEEENEHHKNRRKMTEELIYTKNDAEFTKGEIKNDRNFQQKEGNRNGRDLKFNFPKNIS